MLAVPVTLTVPADAKPFNCLSPGTAEDRKQNVDALYSEAKAYPLKVLDPGDDLLPLGMPDLFKPQLVITDAELDQDGRVSDCRVRQQSKFQVLNAASCELVRNHYVARQPVGSKKQKIAVDWTPRTADPERRACFDRNGTVPIAASLWTTSAIFKGAKLQNGAAFIALDVGTAGVADRCTVLAADVSGDLQRNLCRVVVQRATVLPAADGHGNLVPARMKMVVRFIVR